MESITGIIAILCTIGLPLVWGIWVGVKNADARHTERMAMIERGMTLEEPVKRVNNYAALRNGFLMVGLALGAFVGLLMEDNVASLMWNDGFVMFLCAIMGGGISFIIYFFIARRLEKGERPRG